VVTTSIKHIGNLLFSKVDVLNAVGPWETFSIGTRDISHYGFAVSCLSQNGGLIPRANGLVLHAYSPYGDAPSLEVLVYSDGADTWPQLLGEVHLDWVRRRRQEVLVMTSVCTGCLAYAAAGILENRRATTHWAALDRLSELGPTIDVQGIERFIDDGDVITSSGVSAGIDRTLHLVSRLDGRPHTEVERQKGRARSGG
jgi:transcriptional regulator GlxA family with amidase domain